MREICIKKLNVTYENGKTESFHAHLILNKTEENSEITLKLYHNGYPKLMAIGNYLFGNEREDLLNVDITSVNDKTIKSLKIPSDKIYTIVDTSSPFDNGNKFITFYIKEVLIEYDLQDSKIQNSGIYESDFHLSKKSIPLIAKNYSFNIDYLGKWEAFNRQKKFRHFGSSRYRFLMCFTQKNTFSKDGDMTFNRYPVLQFKYKMDDINIQSYASLSVSLLSFYLNDFIDYYYGYYYYNNSKYVQYKVVNNDSKESKSTRCRHSNYNSIYDLFSSIKNKKVAIAEYDTIRKFIDKFILASKLDGESKFMLYFSIFEGIRNYFVKKKKSQVKENFDFKSTNHRSTIKQKLEEISLMITKNEMKLFKESIDGKVTNLKRYPMKEQMNIFLNSKGIKVNPKDYDLDFKKVLNYRHKIFHGNFLKNDKELKDLNIKMQKFSAHFIRILLNQRR